MHFERFSRWKAWQARTELDRLHFPGIYALAISPVSLSDQVFSCTNQIVYFGMTNSVAGLQGRLKQFDNTIHEKTGHGGADRFRHDYPKPKDLLHQLYVAVLPFECEVSSNTPSDLLTMGKVAMAEYECFARYAELFGHLPKYNDKKKSPKFSRTVRDNDS